MNEKVIETLRHIFDARIDNAESLEVYLTWCEARDIVEYALANNLDTLNDDVSLLLKKIE